MYSICKINNAELLFGPCPSQLIPLNESIKSYVNQGIDVVISLLEEHEQNAIGLEEESLLCEEAGIIFFHFPIVDVSVPSLNRLSQNINTFYEYTLTKNKMFIHCKHGIGRSAMVTASLMIKNGMDLKESLDIISSKRGLRVPETISQKKLLSAYYLKLQEQ